MMKKRDPALLAIKFFDKHEREKEKDSGVSDEEDVLAQEILDAKDSGSLATALKAFIMQCKDGCDDEDSEDSESKEELM